MNLLLFIETLSRIYYTLAQSVYRRLPNNLFRPFKWFFYFCLYGTAIGISFFISKRRASLMFILYAWFRIVDDIIDGDTRHHPEEVAALIREKTNLLDVVRDGIHLDETAFTGNDRLILFGIRFAKDLGFEKDFRYYFHKIWSLMIMENEWKQKEYIPSQTELQEFAQMQDEAILFFGTMILNMHRDKFEELQVHKLGLFTRVDWLNDMHKDLLQGIVHLPKEHCQYSYQDLVKENAPYVLSQADTYRLIKSEVQALLPLWQIFSTQKQEMLSAVPSSIARFFYKMFVLRRFENEYRALCKKFEVTYS